MSKWSAAYRDSRWQKLRLEAMQRDGWKCRSCRKDSEDGVTLNVHHIYYESGKAPWEYTLNMLVTLCEDCHKAIHDKQKELLFSIVGNWPEDGTIQDRMEEAVGYSHGRDGGPSYGESDEYAVGYARGFVDFSKAEARRITKKYSYDSIKIKGGAQ
jgi:hypothetical protein